MSFENPLEILLIVFWSFLLYVPTMGGSVGMLISSLTDLIKVVAKLLGKPLADGVGGKIILVLHVIAVIIIVALEQAPVFELPSKYDLEELEILAQFITMFATVLVSFASSKLPHSMLKKFAPDWFSLSS